MATSHPAMSYIQQKNNDSPFAASQNWLCMDPFDADYQDIAGRTNSQKEHLRGAIGKAEKELAKWKQDKLSTQAEVDREQVLNYLQSSKPCEPEATDANKTDMVELLDQLKELKEQEKRDSENSLMLNQGKTHSASSPLRDRDSKRTRVEQMARDTSLQSTDTSTGNDNLTVTGSVATSEQRYYPDAADILPYQSYIDPRPIHEENAPEPERVHIAHAKSPSTGNKPGNSLSKSPPTTPVDRNWGSPVWAAQPWSFGSRRAASPGHTTGLTHSQATGFGFQHVSPWGTGLYFSQGTSGAGMGITPSRNWHSAVQPPLALMGPPRHQDKSLQRPHAELPQGHQAQPSIRTSGDDRGVSDSPSAQRSTSAGTTAGTSRNERDASLSRASSAHLRDQRLDRNPSLLGSNLTGFSMQSLQNSLLPGIRSTPPSEATVLPETPRDRRSTRSATPATARTSTGAVTLEQMASVQRRHIPYVTVPIQKDDGKTAWRDPLGMPPALVEQLEREFYATINSKEKTRVWGKYEATAKDCILTNVIGRGANSSEFASPFRACNMCTKGRRLCAKLVTVGDGLVALGFHPLHSKERQPGEWKDLEFYVNRK